MEMQKVEKTYKSKFNVHIIKNWPLCWASHIAIAQHLEISKARIPGQNVQHAILRQIKISRSPIVKVSSSHSPSGERESA